MMKLVRKYLHDGYVDVHVDVVGLSCMDGWTFHFGLVTRLQDITQS